MMDMKLMYRYEVEGMHEGKKLRVGLFHIPDTWIHDKPDSNEGLDLWFRFYAIFEDELPAPIEIWEKQVDSISFFTEKGLRKFRKQLRFCKELLESRNCKVTRFRCPMPDPDKLKPIHEDQYQLIYERIPWREAMTNWLKSEGIDVDARLKELEEEHAIC